MRRTVSVILLVLALLASTATAEAQNGNKAPTVPPTEDDSDRRESGQGRGRGGDAKDRQADEDDIRGRDRPRDDLPAVALGKFNLEASQRAISGDFVTFSYNETSIRDFTAGGVPLFNVSVEPDGEDEDAASARVRGSELRLETSAFRLKAHDNPGAVVKLDTAGTATLTFADTVQVNGSQGNTWRFRVGNLTGTLRGESLEVNGNNVTASDGFLLFLDTPRGGFDKFRPQISEAIGKGTVGAEMSIQRAEGDVKSEVASYGNVTMTTVRAERGNLTLLVEGHGTEGRVVVLNVDPGLLGAERKEDLRIFLDNLSIVEADGLEDILDPDNDGYTPEYYVVFDPGQDAFQLLVSVPHYSVHTLSVTTAFVLPPPSVVFGIVAGLFVLVPSGYLLFRPRRD